jgi:hypothetical protein
MRERDRIALRAHREEIVALERTERERTEAPIRAAEEQLRQTSVKLHAVIRERVEKGHDDELYVSPALVGARMTQQEAARHNTASGKLFLERNPWFYNTPDNIRTVIEYFLRNHTNVIDAEMWERAAKRLAEFNLLPDHRPEQEPEPQPEPQPVEPSKPEVFEGRDPATGEPRTYTKRQVYLMDAETYRRTFETATTFKDVFIAMREQREAQQ